MGRKLTQTEFVEKARATHGETYNYDLVDYKNNHTKIKITCVKHGIFMQSPRDHIVGNACKQCSLEKSSTIQRMSMNEFLQKASKAHGQKYNYSLVQFTNGKNKIKIICPKHGLFEQKLSLHIFGSGCPSCGIEHRSQTHLSSTEEFIKSSIKIHKDKYDYSETEYINAKSLVKIKCNEHGIFRQIPASHLNGSGCEKCGKIKKAKSNTMNSDDFINAATICHNGKYDYSETEYISYKTPIKIKCKKHGIFYQKPNDHLGGCGCSKCNKVISGVEIRWLDALGIPNDILHRNVKIRIGKKYYKLDGFDPENNIIYEFYGDLWHGNPNRYNPNDICKMTKKTFGEMFTKTMKREEELKNAGYQIKTIWETDYRKIYE